LQVSPEKMKDRLLAKMKNFEAEVLGRKCDVLQPVVIGVSWWSPDAQLDPIDRKLQDFHVILTVGHLSVCHPPLVPSMLHGRGADPAL